MAEASYTSTLSHAGVAVGYISGSLDTAAGALTSLAGVIEDSQDTVRRAAMRLREAREAARGRRRQPRTPVPQPPGHSPPRCSAPRR